MCFLLTQIQQMGRKRRSLLGPLRRIKLAAVAEIPVISCRRATGAGLASAIIDHLVSYNHTFVAHAGIIEMRFSSAGGATRVPIFHVKTKRV
jgi:hypothetical protein